MNSKKHFIIVIISSFVLTFFCFMSIPLIQIININNKNDTITRNIEIIQLPPPPPPFKTPPEKKKEKKEKLKLKKEIKPLDLSQLELALNNKIDDNFLNGDFTIELNKIISNENNIDNLFSFFDLDQKPRIIYQPSPIINNEIKQKFPGKVYIIFIVNENGNVVDPIIQKSTNVIFEKSALQAVKKWKFEPGKYNGNPVKFRMKVPIVFSG